MNQLPLFQQEQPQPKSAEQLAYEAWPFPGLSWERHVEIRAEWDRYHAENFRRERKHD